MATRIIDIEQHNRERAFEIVERNMQDSMHDTGTDPASPTARKWLDFYMKALRALIRDIEASGGGRSGNA